MSKKINDSTHQVAAVHHAFLQASPGRTPQILSFQIDGLDSLAKEVKNEKKIDAGKNKDKG